MSRDFDILKKHLSFGDIEECLMQPDKRCLGSLQPKMWMVSGYEGLLAYHNLSEVIHNEKEIFTNYTIQQVYHTLDKSIIEKAKNNNINHSEFLNLVKNKLPNKQIKSYDVLRNIWGITLSKKYRKLGPFTFQKAKNGIRFLTKNLQRNILPKNLIISDYIVRYTIHSSTKERAIEIADENFKCLELLFAFLLGRKDSGHEVRILDQTKGILLFHLIRDENGEVTIGNSRKNTTHHYLDLNNNYFQQKIL